MNNLPPGVREADIPGNRPEDVAFDQIIDGPLGEFLSTQALKVVQVQDKLVSRLHMILSDIWFCEVCGTLCEEGQSACSEPCAVLLDQLISHQEEEPDWL